MITRKSGLILLLVIMSHFLYSQNETRYEEEKDTILLKDLVIQENRLDYRFSEASRNMGLVEKKEIRSLPVENLPEILSTQPAVDIRQRGPGGVQADVGIRGGTFEQTLILLNGVKMSDPQTGHHLLNVPIMFDNLDRIEIIKGPAARIYGQNAYAGAINFITKVPEKNVIRVRSYGGDFGAWGASISASYRNQHQGQYISFGTDHSNGYRHNTDYKINNAFYQGELNLNKYDKVDYFLGITQRKFGANGFYASPDYSEQYEEVRTSTASISYTHEKGKFKITPRISWRNNKDEYDFVRDDPGVYQNLHYTNTYSIETNSAVENNFGTTGFGVEFRHENINGDWLRGGNKSKSNLDGFSRDNFGAFVEHRFTSSNQKFDITPGLYFGWYSDFGTQFFPGIDAGYNVSNDVRLYGNIGKSYRIPTFYDQYYESPVEQGNPDLDPEYSWNYEVGARFLKNDFLLEGNIFYRDNQNLIDWIYNTQDSVWRSRNFSVVKTKGIELLISYQKPITIIDHQFFIDRISISYNKLDQDKKMTDEQSRYALEHLSDQFIICTDINIYKNLRTSWSGRFIKRIEQDAYPLLDGRIYWQDKIFSIFIEATNITNTEYSEVFTPMPGRWFRGGFVMTLGY